jgi:hypothetical protein
MALEADETACAWLPPALLATHLAVKRFEIAQLHTWTRRVGSKGRRCLLSSLLRR